MNPTEPPRAGSTRFTDIGDVEIFDGESWQAIGSLLTDATVGDRGDRLTPPLPDPVRPALPRDGDVAPD